MQREQEKKTKLTTRSGRPHHSHTVCQSILAQQVPYHGRVVHVVVVIVVMVVVIVVIVVVVMGAAPIAIHTAAAAVVHPARLHLRQRPPELAMATLGILGDDESGMDMRAQVEDNWKQGKRASEQSVSRDCGQEKHC